VQWSLFDNSEVDHNTRRYLPFLTVAENGKGVLDVDTVKGCTLGMAAYPDGGCYGECYANKTATRYGIDFTASVSRVLTRSRFAECFDAVKNYSSTWYRIGTAGDPSHDWEHTISVCEQLRHTGKIPVIITKHWLPLSDDQLPRLKSLSAVINTSVSGLDTDHELQHRLGQMARLEAAGVRSVARVVSCSSGLSDWAKSCREKQEHLLSLPNRIDNPLRATKANKRVTSGDIILTRQDGSIGGGKMVSLHSPDIYLGTCDRCTDQCGVAGGLANIKTMEGCSMELVQGALFEHTETPRKATAPAKIAATGTAEYIYVKSVIGSGYEADVAALAIEDGIAYRAARKNMQIHSAIILKIDGEVSGFFTFQNNEDAKEFCLLQSTIKAEKFDFALYDQMVLKIIEQNVNSYPAIITTDPRSKFETPKKFKQLGFKTYLKMSGFEYMVYGNEDDVRMKLLAHITMTNVWNSIKGDWLRLKKEWNEKIEASGAKYAIPNPKFASREGCWQGESGFSNVVFSSQTVEGSEVKTSKGKSHNGNASVLDPVACEVILRFFMPKAGRRVYNPFGGGVQMGYVTGSYGYDYTASEIRQNQCDANNAICQDLNSAKWIRSDTSQYTPEGKFDLVFTCPPYYKVEKYIDYDGIIPDGEINNMSTYEQFRNTLFAGYKKAIEALNDNCFFVVMTGDSRGKDGGYYCSESETELFFKEQGLLVYNKIIYLECEFTRLAQAKKTLNYRKFPKREQKIIVAYKGDPTVIKDLYPTVGRL
jgi:hypothetical protein